MSNLERMLIRIMMVLVVLSLTLCSIAFAYLLVHGEKVREALSFTVVLLVASIPIAIEIVCTTTLALGSRNLSADGAIVSRLAAIEDMAGMDMLCSDKTGTLTLNKMVIQDHTPAYLAGETQYSILRYAAMAAKWREPPRDALDTLTLTSVDLPSLDKVSLPLLTISPLPHSLAMPLPRLPCPRLDWMSDSRLPFRCLLVPNRLSRPTTCPSTPPSSARRAP